MSLGLRNLSSKALRGRENSAEVTSKLRELASTSEPHGSPRTLRTLETLDKLGSRSLQSHFEATWVEETRLEATSKLLRNHFGSRQLESRPLRGQLARLACLGSAWLDSASLNVARLGSAQPGSASLDPRGLTQLGLCRNCSKKLLMETIRENCLGATELCLP